MSNVKLLLDVVSNMRSLADSLEAAADVMIASSKSVPETTPEAETTQEHTLTKENVRAVLSSKMKEHKEEIQALLLKYGNRKLSEIDPKHYPALLADAEALK